MTHLCRRLEERCSICTLREEQRIKKSGLIAVASEQWAADAVHTLSTTYYYRDELNRDMTLPQRSKQKNNAYTSRSSRRHYYSTEYSE